MKTKTVSKDKLRTTDSNVNPNFLEGTQGSELSLTSSAPIGAWITTIGLSLVELFAAELSVIGHQNAHGRCCTAEPPEIFTSSPVRMQAVHGHLQQNNL